MGTVLLSAEAHVKPQRQSHDLQTMELNKWSVSKSTDLTELYIHVDTFQFLLLVLQVLFSSDCLVS